MQFRIFWLKIAVLNQALLHSYDTVIHIIMLHGQEFLIPAEKLFFLIKKPKNLLVMGWLKNRILSMLRCGLDAIINITLIFCKTSTICGVKELQ